MVSQIARGSHYHNACQRRSKIFADDVAMYRSVHSTGDCNAFQQDLDSIAVWCSKWQMRLNVSKCELLNKRAPTKPSYYINNYNLSYVKYLGVFVDSKLSWNYHVSYVSAKAAKVLNLLRRHMYTCQSSSKHKAFRALVLPILDYASVVWNPHTHKNVSTLEKIQIEVPVGCVEADLTLKLPNGQNLQLTAAESVSGHHYLPGESISV